MSKYLQVTVSTNQKIKSIDLESVKKPFEVFFYIGCYYIRAPPTPI